MTPTNPTPYGSVPAALAIPGVARPCLTASRAAPLFSNSCAGRATGGAANAWFDSKGCPVSGRARSFAASRAWRGAAVSSAVRS